MDGVVGSSEDVSLVDLFPCFVPLTSSFDSFQGWVPLQGREYPMRLDVPPTSTSLKDATLEVHPVLEQAFGPFLGVLKARLRDSQSIVEFSVEVQHLLLSLPPLSLPPLPPPKGIRRILQEVGEVERYCKENHPTTSSVSSRLGKVNEGLEGVEIITRDRGGREHTLVLKLPTAFPAVPPECRADLPRPFVPKWSTDATLRSVVEQFEGAVHEFQDLWTVLADLDQHAWILEPSHVTYSGTTRRVALGSGASLFLSLEISRPRGVPECSFLGADRVIGPLRDHLNLNLHRWDSQALLRKNLEVVLGQPLPLPTTVVGEDSSWECGICYAFRLGEAVPDRLCDYQSCGKAFHRNCLALWLRALPSSRQSFDTLFGACPYCSSPISCSLK